MYITAGQAFRGASELGSGQLVPAGTPIFQSSGSGRNWNSVIFRELE
jgi:hypothetical protein